MKVKDIMTPGPKTCTPDTSLAAAAKLMWEGDCGILPVVEDGRLVGVVTDRDAYIALATRDARASQLAVGDVANRTVVTCEPETDMHAALNAMKQARVRRLPVVGFGGAVLGILSMNDVIRAAATNKSFRNDAVDTLQAICAHHRPPPHVVAA